MPPDASERARLETALATLAADDPEAALLHRDLGRLCHDMRDFAAAVEHLETARAMHAAAGPGPELATDCNHLALVLHDLGELDEARTLLDRALAMDEQVLGADHQNVARDANNLAGVLRDMGEPLAAAEALRWALSFYQARLGPDHPTTQSVARNLRITELM